MAEKIYNEKEFIKFYLSEFNSKHACNFCKYNATNYKDMDETIAKINRANKCMGCIHLPSNMALEKMRGKRKLFNNFKPLYGWENIDKE